MVSDSVADHLHALVERWKDFEGTERSGGQSFLNDLLNAYEVEAHPGKLFEQHPMRIRRVQTNQGSLFAHEEVVEATAKSMDMFIPKVVIWEMKSPAEKDLEKHHDQLLAYWARARTRFMVLCNFREFWIYDTDQDDGQLKPAKTFKLAELPDNAAALAFLRGEESHFAQRSVRVTQHMASEIGGLVRRLIEDARGAQRERESIAKFILECVFAMFAEDADLIPRGMFSRALKESSEQGGLGPVNALFDDFARAETQLKTNKFAPYVNGTLFDRAHPKLKLSQESIDALLHAATRYDWQDVRPEIFGSIFEQAMGAAKRHELGAHFTHEEDILRIVTPTIIEPWRQRIAATRKPKDVERVIEQMRAFHILDPACGCGNFLYVAYREMKRLEAAVRQAWDAAHRRVAKKKADMVRAPREAYFTLDQIHGIEIDPFSAQLTRVVLWIGEYLAKRELGLDEETLPLKNLNKNIRDADALLTDWHRPEGELAIIGNPPYLGVRRLRAELGDAYVEEIFEAFPDNRAADLVTYWYTKALQTMRPGERAGFVSTNSITQNESREASIDRIVEKGGQVVDAWRSYVWPGEAAVHVSIVNWILGPHEGLRTLDGHEVSAITPALTDGVDVSQAKTLVQNQGLSFMGVTPGNKEFVLDDEQRQEILAADPKSAKVIKRFLIGRDVNQEVDQKATRWIIDFGLMEKDEAAEFTGAFRYVQKHVYPIRKSNRRESRARNWWRFAEPAPDLRRALGLSATCVVIAALSKRHMPLRVTTNYVIDHQLFAFALSESYHLGILQSRFHETWARARGSTLKSDLRYTGTTIFETFPFPPRPTGKYDPRVVPKTPQARRIAEAAEAFDGLRRKVCREKQLGLTKIHNLLADGELPQLSALYEELNEAVTAAYGWPEGTWRDENETLKRLLALNKALARP